MTVSYEEIRHAKEMHPLAFRDPPAVQARKIGFWVLFIGLFCWCLYDFNFSPARIWEGLGRFGRVLSFMFPPHIWESWEDWSMILEGLGETVSMAFMGTILGAIIAFPLSFLGAKNINRIFWLRQGSRRFYDVIRAFETLILALIFIRAFGLGPLTGALAIALTDTGTLGKLFSEALENVDNRQIEGVRATGAGQLQRYRFGVIPQIMPVFISQGLYYLESNTRSATVIGALGAGGIGLVLVETLRTSRDWENTLYIILLTVIVVVLMDQLSSWLRRRLITGE